MNAPVALNDEIQPRPCPTFLFPACPPNDFVLRKRPERPGRRTWAWLVLLNVLLSSLTLRAEVKTWKGGTIIFGDPDAPFRWSLPGNWNPSGVPQNGDDLEFYLTAAPGQGTLVLMIDDVPNLSVASMSFGANADFQTTDFVISGSETLGVTGPIELPASTDVYVDIAVGLQLGSNVKFRVDYFAQDSKLLVEGPVDLNGHDLSLEGETDDSIEVSGVISGSGNILVTPGSSAGTVKLSGASGNTFSGNVTLIAGPGFMGFIVGTTLVLAKQSGLGVPGNLTLDTNCTVKLDQPHQIADAAAVSIRPGGQLKLQGNTETIGSLSLAGGRTGAYTNQTIVDSGGATLSVDNNITSSNNLSDPDLVPVIKGKLGLPPGNHSITVSGNQYYGLDIQAQILGDGGFTKNGAQALLLQSSNSFNGEAIVRQGALELRHGNALGSVAGFTTLSNSGSLFLNNVSIYGESLFVRGDSIPPNPVLVGGIGSQVDALGTNVWSGPLIIDSPYLVVNGGTINLNGLISGPGNLLCLAGTVEISGTDANTFSGTLYVYNPLLLLNKSSGVAAFGGPLRVDGILNFSEARWLQDFQRVNANVTLYANALVNLNNHSDDFGPITFNGGDILTGSGALGIYGLVTANSASVAATINGHMVFPSGYHEFLVQPSISLSGLQLNADISGSGHLRKTGPGHLWLNHPNTYTGLTVLDAGYLMVNDVAALGDAATGTTVNDGATLALAFTAGQVPEPIAIRGIGAAGDGALDVYGNAVLRTPFPAIYACIDLTTNATIRIESGGKLTADGFVSGTGPLIKAGPGTLVFSNANANTYSGDTVVSEGTLELRKPNNIISVPGNLVLGPAIAASPSTARWFQAGPVNATAYVTVNANSLLDLNGFDQTLARLNLNDGGDAQTGAGRLNISPGGVVQVGSLSPSGSHASSSIAGNFGLPANNFITFNVAPYAISPPFATAPELDVPALISVNGAESPILEPAGFSKVSLGWMRLLANNTYKGEAFISGGTLQVEGSQPQSSARAGDGGRLQGSGTIGHVYFQGSSGVIAPGASPGILTTSNFNAGASGSGVLQIELNGTAPGAGHDQVNVRGSVTLTGTSLSGSLNFSPATSDQFTIINNDGSDAVIGTFNGLPQGATLYLAGEEFQVSYTGGSGNDVVLTRTSTPPPPRLTIEAVPPSWVRLLWPTNDPAFYLQFNTNLATTHWMAASPLPVIIGTNFVVTNATRGLNPSFISNVVWYRLGEDDPGAAPGVAVTNTTTDSAGGHHLKQFGSPLYTGAVSTEATNQVASSLGVQLNGISQYLSNAVVTSAVDNFGLEAWVKPNTISGTYNFVAYNGNTANNGWGIAWQNGTFQGWFGNVVLFGSGAVTPGTWAHVALVRDNGFSTLYLNGVPVSSPTGFGPNPPDTGFALGIRPQTPAAEFFNGAIDEVRVFTFAPGQFTTNDLLLNRTANLAGAAKFYRLAKP